MQSIFFWQNICTKTIFVVECERRCHFKNIEIVNIILKTSIGLEINIVSLIQRIKWVFIYIAVLFVATNSFPTELGSTN